MLKPRLKENDKIRLKDGTEGYFICFCGKSSIIMDYPAGKDENGNEIYGQGTINISEIERIVD